MAIKFLESYKHEKLEFFPDVSLAFEDPDAETFFKKLKVAEDTADAPVRTYTQDEVSIDPETVFADGTKVADAEEGGLGALERQRPGAIQPHDQLVPVDVVSSQES